MLDARQHSPGAYQHEQGRCEPCDGGCEADVPAWRREQGALLHPGHAHPGHAHPGHVHPGHVHPGHAAPRPHRASPSVCRTWLTKVDRGTQPTALSMTMPRTEDAPVAKLYW